MPLKEVLTTDEPFGPIDQTEVRDLSDAISLLEYTDVISSAHKARHPLIYGRKGSGKSALLAAYHNFDYVKSRNRHPLSEKQRNAENDFLIAMVAWEQFDDMVRSVFREMSPHGANISNGGIDRLHVPTEKLEQIWTQHIWDRIFRHCYSLHRMGKIDTYEVTNVINYCNARSPLSPNDDPLTAAARIFSAAKDEVNRLLEKRAAKCIVLFDNMEEYPVNNPAFKATLSGFLRAIKRFHLESRFVRIIFCLPEEIMPHVTSASTNLLKDFDRAFAMRWKPRDLVLMAAHRYRLFLDVNREDSPSLNLAFLEFEELDFRNGDDLSAFFKRLVPDYMTNDFGMRESTLAYIIRHTQLLPRHMLAYLNEIARQSRDLTGGWRLEADAVLRGVTAKEEFVANEILKPFEYLYPGLTASLKENIPNLTPVFEYGQLDKLTSRLRRNIELERYEYWSLLYRIGIIGRVSDEAGSGKAAGSMYTYADFHFNTAGEVGFPTEGLYCLHPVFSRFFNCNKNRGGDKRLIYPNKVSLELNQ